MPSYSVKRSKEKKAKMKARVEDPYPESRAPERGEGARLVIVEWYACLHCETKMRVQWSSGDSQHKILRCDCGVWYHVSPMMPMVAPSNITYAVEQG